MVCVACTLFKLLKTGLKWVFKKVPNSNSKAPLGGVQGTNNIIINDMERILQYK